MQVARHARAFFLLRMHHALGQALQLGAGHAVVAEIERQPRHADEHDAQRRNAEDAPARGRDVGLGAFVDLAQRLLHIVQVQARAQRPAPFGDRGHVGELGLGTQRGRLLPLVAHQAAAAARGIQDDPGGPCAARAVGIAQVHARQAHLPRIQQHVAVFVVDKEVAVLAELHARQRIQRLAPLHGWLLAAGLDARQRRGRQLHVVPQLGLLAVQVGGLDQLSFLAGQLQCLVLHGHRDQAQGQRDGGNRQKRKFQRKLHGSLCGVHRRSFPPSARTLSTGLARMAPGPGSGP